MTVRAAVVIPHPIQIGYGVVHPTRCEPAERKRAQLFEFLVKAELGGRNSLRLRNRDFTMSNGNSWIQLVCRGSGVREVQTNSNLTFGSARVRMRSTRRPSIELLPLNRVVRPGIAQWAKPFVSTTRFELSATPQLPPRLHNVRNCAKRQPHSVSSGEQPSADRSQIDRVAKSSSDD